MKHDNVLREQLLAILRGGNAHMGFDEAVASFPAKHINKKPPNFNYTFWHLLEHMRRAQKDILEFVRDPGYVSPDYAEFWPDPDKKATESQWKKTVKDFRADLKAVEDLVRNPGTDFFSPIPHAKDYIIFREVLLVADHNAYHTGEIITLRQALGINPPVKW
ncbi:MAG: DinB family protein [Candidatus Sulfobium sp.]|jgi:DinB superfamily